MKNLIFLTTLGMLLLTGCSKQEMQEQITDQSFDTVYILKQAQEGVSSLQTLTMSQLLAKSDVGHAATISQNGHTEGYFHSGTRDFTEITWLGIKTDRGITGEAEVKISSPSGSFHFILKTECVNVLDNEAVYGGIVARVLEASGDASFLETGWRFYFKVLDFDGVSRSELDKISNVKVFASPTSTSLCGLDVRSDLWASAGYQDVVSPGYVNIN